MRNHHDRLTSHLKRRVLLPLSVLVVIAHSGLGAILWERGQNRENQVFNKIVVHVADSVNAALWSYDITAIKSIITKFQRQWGLEGVRVTDTYGSPIEPDGAEMPSRKPTVSVLLQDSGPEQLGRVEVWKGSSASLSQSELFLFVVLVLSCGVLLAGLNIGVQTFARRYLIDQVELLDDWLHDQRQKVTSPPNQFLSSEIEDIAHVTHRALSKNRVEIEDLTSRLKRSDEYLDWTLNLLSHSRQTYILASADGSIIKNAISRPFASSDLQALVEITADPSKARIRFADLGMEVVELDPQFDTNHVVAELIGSDGASIEAILKTLPDGHRAILLSSPEPHSSWTYNALDDFLKRLGVGMGIFDRNGSLALRAGLPLETLLANGSPSGENLQLSDLLFNLMRQGRVDSETEASVFEHEIRGRMFRVSVQERESNWMSFIFHDITEQRRTEHAMTEMQRLKDIGSITSGVAHDFNNSLSIIVGQLELALGESDPQRMEDCMQTALKVTSQAASVVAQLRAYSRNQPLAPRVIEIDAQIREEKRVLQQALRDQQELVLELNANSGVFLDAEQFSAAMLNLVINARDFMDDRGVVTVRSRHDSARNAVIVDVEDNGTGIPDTLLYKIFDPFFTTKSVGQGSGLGLSSVRGFIEQSQGSIEASNTKSGARISMSLPRVEYLGAHVTKTRRKKLPDMSKFATQFLKDLPILIVDDDILLLETLKRLIELNGYPVNAYENSQEAMEFVKSGEQFLCAIVDLRMPVISGIDLSRCIREFHNDVPILVCSGNVEQISQKERDELRFDQVISKPVPSSVLIGAISELVPGSTRRKMYTKEKVILGASGANSSP